MRASNWHVIPKLRPKNKHATVLLELTEYEAIELAGYLNGTDMHLSIGDRLTLARRLRDLAQ